MKTGITLASLAVLAVFAGACGGDSEATTETQPTTAATPDGGAPASEVAAAEDPAPSYADELGEALKPIGALVRNQEDVTVALARELDVSDRATAVENVEAAREAVATIDVEPPGPLIERALTAFFEEAGPIAERLDQAATDGDLAASAQAEVDLALAYHPVMSAMLQEDDDSCLVAARSFGKAEFASSYCPERLNGDFGATLNTASRRFALGTNPVDPERMLQLFEYPEAWRRFILEVDPVVQPAYETFLDSLELLRASTQDQNLMDRAIAFFEANRQIGLDLQASAEAGDDPMTMVREILQPADAAYAEFASSLDDTQCAAFVELQC